MANFCNKCGAPVSGIFCVKCGADTRLAGSPAPQAAPPQSPPVQISPVQAAPAPAPPLQAAPPPPAPAAPAPMPPPAVAAVPASPYAKFCNKCGTPSIGTAFCNKCGADMRQATAPALPATPVSQAAPAAPVPAAQAQTKGSPLTKILIGFAVVVIAVGAMAAGGVYYVVYRVKQKVHEVARDAGLSPTPDSSSGSGGILGSISRAVSGSSGGSSDSDTNGGISGDPCRLLSTQEVGRAIGVEIVATQPAEGGCSYLAHGDSGDMTAKHMAAMMAKNGADAKTQQMIQGFAGGMAKAFQSEGHEKTSDSNGNVPVFTFGVDDHAAEAQMRLNAKVLGRLGPGQVDIPGIGDQAFDEAGAMLMVRKGDKMIRIMYSTCPCSLDAIKPLAKMLADRL